MALFSRRRRRLSSPSAQVSPAVLQSVPGRLPRTGFVAATAEQVFAIPSLGRAIQALCGYVAGLPLVDLDTNERIVHDPERQDFFGCPTTSGMTWFEFMDAVMTGRLVEGNSVAVWTGIDPATGDPNRCELVNPSFVTPSEDRSREFMPGYRIDGKRLQYPDVMHFRGQMRPGYAWGISPLKMLSETIVVHASQRSYVRSGYEDGAKVPGYLRTEQNVDPKVLAADATAFSNAVAGRGQGVAAIGRGLTWEPMALSSADVDLLASRNFSQTEACMIVGVPPHLVGAPSPENSSMSYSNLTMDLRAFRAISLDRHLKSIEQTLHMHGFRVRFDVDEAIRPPAKERWETYEIMLGTGAVSLEQICEMEGLPPPPEPEETEDPDEPETPDDERLAAMLEAGRQSMEEGADA